MSPETRVKQYDTADSMGLSSFIFCGGVRNTHLFWNRMRIGHSRSSKVVDFGTNRKGVCDVLLVINSNFGPILAPFLRYGELLAENCEFFLPYPCLTPSLGVNPFEFLNETYRSKTRGMGYCMVKITRKLHDPNLSRFCMSHLCDRQTVRQTDRRNCDSICALSIMLSRAINALQKTPRNCR